MSASGAEVVERLVLDTSAYSRFRTGHAAMGDMIARAPVVLIPVVVLGELEAAFEIGSRTVENRLSLAEFLAEPFVAVYDVTRAVARRYGEVFSRLRRAGTPVATNDIWIAATTIDSGGHLITFDSDFGRIEGLSRTILL